MGAGIPRQGTGVGGSEPRLGLRQYCAIPTGTSVAATRSAKASCERMRFERAQLALSPVEPPKDATVKSSAQTATITAGVMTTSLNLQIRSRVEKGSTQTKSSQYPTLRLRPNLWGLQTFAFAFGAVESLHGAGDLAPLRRPVGYGRAPWLSHRADARWLVLECCSVHGANC